MSWQAVVIAALVDLKAEEAAQVVAADGSNKHGGAAFEWSSMQEAAAVEQRAGGSVQCEGSVQEQLQQSSMQEAAAERRLHARGSCRFEKASAGAAALGGAALGDSCRAESSRAACKRQLQTKVSPVVGSESSSWGAGRWWRYGGGGRAAGGSSGAKELWRRAAKQKRSCGGGQQSRRAVVKGSRAKEELR